MAYKVALDAGHGINTLGKRCDARYDPNQTREWWLNSRIAEKVMALASAHEGIEIMRTDDPNGSIDVGLSTRCNKANSWGANIFVSIHHNAAGGHGIEVHAHPQSPAKTRELQRLMADELIKANGNRGTRYTSVPLSNFQVLRGTKMPAVLIENGFMDNPIDVPLILSEDYAQKSAQGIMNAIAIYGGIKKKEGGATPEPTPQPPATIVNVYEAVKGDTLSGIAKRYGMKLTDLLALNPQISNPNLIRVGQKIVIGGAAPMPSAEYLSNPSYKGGSIVDALKGISVNSSLASRERIAAVNGIAGYRGTAAQNKKLLDLLKSGKLIKA